MIAPSRWTARRLVELAPGIPEPAVVPNGVEVPPRGAARPPLRRPAPTGYLLHVGHLEGRKNVEVVVRALAALPGERRPELWLAGRDAGAGRSVARQPFVRWFGAVDDAELPSLYANARAVVVPSRHEGFGLCALEGLAYGRPVLASDASALPEVLGGHGVLLPPDDPAAWAAAIAALGGEDAALAEARRSHARRYTWSAAAARLVEVWRRVHEARARRQRTSWMTP